MSSQMPDDILLPCPFCGQQPVSFSGEALGRTIYVVECGNPDCPASMCGCGYESKEEAVANWNTRYMKDSALPVHTGFVSFLENLKSLCWSIEKNMDDSEQVISALLEILKQEKK